MFKNHSTITLTYSTTKLTGNNNPYTQQKTNQKAELD